MCSNGKVIFLINNCESKVINVVLNIYLVVIMIWFFGYLDRVYKIVWEK